jgi:hypothetical protein
MSMHGRPLYSFLVIKCRLSSKLLNSRDGFFIIQQHVWPKSLKRHFLSHILFLFLNFNVNLSNFKAVIQVVFLSDLVSILLINIF